MFRQLHIRALIALVLLSCVSFAQQRPELKGTPGTIPTGTQIDVRITESLSSETTAIGEAFHGSLQEDLVINGKVIFPKGAEVTGRVTDAKPSGRLSAPGLLELSLTSIKAGDVSARVVTEPLKIEGESHTRSNTTKIGAGAAVGAVIGAIAGGGKGAAIGTVVGGAAGTGAAAATGKRAATVESEALLSWTTSVDVLASNAPKPSASATLESRAAKEEVRSYNDEVHVEPSSPAATKKASAPAAVSTPAAAVEVAPEFTARDRRVLRTCLTGDTGDLPPGLAKKEQLPPGLEKQVQKNGTLPPGLERRAQPLPLACESQLPRLPATVERVILNRQIILLGAQSRILDIFDLDAE